MADTKHLLKTRRTLRNKRPKFRREGYGTRKKITAEWRKPRGKHSKIRHGFAGKRRKVMPGFRTNKLVRGLHNSGLIPVVICTPKHVPLIDKTKYGAVISGNIGDRKRILLIQALNKHGIKILNLKENHVQKIQEKIALRKKQREEKIASKEKKTKTGKEDKKEQKEQKEMTQEEKESQEKQEKHKVLTKAQK